MNPPAKAFLAAILIGVFSPTGTLAAALAAAQAIVATERTLVFAVENMTCALCPLTVRKAMERVPGVTSVAIDFDAKTATVVYDSSIATVDAIAAASTDVGYPAHVLGELRP